MSNKIEIVNRALRALAEQPIGDINEDSEEAAVMRDVYDIELEAEIRDFPYTWAQRTVELVELTEEAPDYGYVYQLPADYINMVEIINTATGATVWSYWDTVYTFLSPSHAEWEIRENKLYINNSTVCIKYTVIEDNTAKWDGAFTLGFAYKLAAVAGPSLTEKEAMIDRAERNYIVNINKARANSASESRKRLRISEEYINARNV